VDQSGDVTVLLELALLLSVVRLLRLLLPPRQESQRQPPGPQ